ncbi:MAG: SPFH domain-containing protein [Collinsella sp.]
MFFLFDLVGGLFGLAIIFVIVGLVTGNLFFVVKQQHAVIIERLGKFHRIVGAGFHVKIPFIDRKAATVSLRTMKNGFDIDVKTQDNVTIGLEVSAQYHVSYEMGTGPAESGVYKSYYMLQQPVAQMRDFITDALRSSIPVYTLDEVFAKKDDIAKDVNATVSEQMDAYGFTLVSTLITKIALPAEVEDSMNQINAAQRTRLPRRTSPRPIASAASPRRALRPRPWRRPVRALPTSARPSPSASRIRSRPSRRRAWAMPRPTSCSCSPSGRR